MECAHCTKPASMSCKGCKTAPILDGDSGIIHYYNSVCQKEDWIRHKLTCLRLKDRTTLYRVVGTAQKLFYIYRELVWHRFDIQSIDKIGDNLALRGEMLENERWPEDYRSFPSHLMDSNRDREAVLSYLGCSDAVSFMVEFFHGLLKGIVKRSEHVVLKTKNDKRRTRLYSCTVPIADIEADTGGITHEILKVTLRSGEKFAIDLAGAQYGYDDCVVQWKEYEQLRIFRIWSADPPPQHGGILQLGDYSLEKMIYFTQKAGSLKPGGRNLSWDILETMNLHILEWQADENLTIKDLWKLPENQFLVKRADLVDYLEWMFHAVVEHPWYTANGKRLLEIKGKWELRKWQKLKR